MMKGQLAGLMKQAQAMQENLKKAQDELATIEVPDRILAESKAIANGVAEGSGRSRRSVRNTYPPSAVSAISDTISRAARTVKRLIWSSGIVPAKAGAAGS